MLEAIQFSSFSEFIDMGGYADKVWPVYFLFAVFLAVNLIGPRLKRKRILKELKRRVAMGSGNGAPKSHQNT